MTGKALVSGRGRKPKPTAVKERQGNPGKRKLNKDEPQFSEFDEHTPPPDDLDENGKTMWVFVLKRVDPTKSITQNRFADCCKFTALLTKTESKLIVILRNSVA